MRHRWWRRDQNQEGQTGPFQWWRETTEVGGDNVYPTDNGSLREKIGGQRITTVFSVLIQMGKGLFKTEMTLTGGTSRITRTTRSEYTAQHRQNLPSISPPASDQSKDKPDQ